ncbi:ABC transporter substrate-binding protein [Agarivorans sp. Alg241-V36]|uniref:ABC transporter substrate-binding protein n=1 Tax=Agarivorans sp. Alg241-V36 TaxID=2305992 RepID=UPI0013D30E1E|nr:ABC transporter substrate-binding protein [Agarivorans sp. Alg241-V36]
MKLAIAKAVLVNVVFSFPFVVTSAAATAGFELEVEQVKGEITFFTNRTDLIESGVYQQYTEGFKRKYPQVTEVKVVAFADYQGSLRPRMNTNDYGDLVLVLPSVPKEQYSKFYEPLNMYQADEVRFYDVWRHQDKVYGLSMGNQIEGLVYNKQVLAEAQVEVPIRTISELYEAAEKIAKLGKVPFYLNFGAQWPLQYWDKYPVTVAGDRGVYENMLVRDDAFSGETAYHQSFSVLRHLVENKWTEADLMTNSWEESKSTLANGDAGMFYLGSWFIPQVIDRGIDSEHIGIMPMPVNEAGDLRVQLNSDWGYAISKFSKNKETTKAFLMYLLEETNFEEISGFIPTIKSKKVSLAQIEELMSYSPEVIEAPIYSSDFIAVTNRAKIDFYSGGYIQDLVTSSNLEASLKKLDKRWNRAKKRVLK